MGKDFPAYEKILGAPKLVEKGSLNDEGKDPAEKRFHKYPGVVRIVLQKGTDGIHNPQYRSPEQVEQLLKSLPKGARLLGGPQPMWTKKPTRYLSNVSFVQVQFDKKGSIKWQDAMRTVGISPTEVTKAVGFPDKVSYSLYCKGHIYHWVPNTATDGNHALWVDVEWDKNHQQEINSGK